MIETSYTTNQSQTTHVFYTDGSKRENENENGTASVVFAPSRRLFQLIKQDEIHQRCIIDESTKTISKNWNLGPKITSQQTELFAIWKTTVWIKNIIQKSIIKQNAAAGDAKSAASDSLKGFHVVFRVRLCGKQELNWCVPVGKSEPKNF